MLYINYGYFVIVFILFGLLVVEFGWFYIDYIVNKVLFVGNIGELYSCLKRILIFFKKIFLKSYSYSYLRD